MIAASGYLGAEEFKAWNPHLNFADYPVATLSGMIWRCTQLVDDRLHYTLPIEDITGEKVRGIVDTNGDLQIWTRKFPIESISSLKVVKGTTSMTLSLTSGGVNRYDIPDNSAPPAVYPGSEFSVASVGTNLISLRNAPWFFLINYRAGWESIPVAIKEATSLLVQDQMAAGLNPGGFATIKQGQIYYSYGAGGRSSLKREAFMLIDAYRKGWS